ncbi:MAG: YIP1 family protein [Caldilineaceae bacterium]|nr:YIP1 family protein [Caldilineaceae bacterium]
MFQYLWSVWRAIQLGLGLQPEVVQIAESHPNAAWVAFGVVMAAGISLLLGQSVILFLNQVRPGRFAVSLVIHGFMLVTGWLVWSASVWAIGRWLFSDTASFALTLRLIGLSYAPLVFGFLILMPYLGPFVQHLLYVWSFVIALRAVAFSFDFGFWPALLCVGLGWLLLMLLTATVGRPIVALRNLLWHRLTGTSLDASAHELLQQFALDKSASSTPKGDKP